MQRVELQEFGERASDLLTGSEALTVERQGRAIGIYLPLPHPAEREQEQDAHDSIAALRAAVTAARANGQLTEDELADLFDLRHPVP